MNAPIKNPEEALASHLRARNDIIKQQQQIIETLSQMLNVKGGNGQGQNPQGQHRNAKRGRSQPQAGQRSMTGGTSPLSPVG